ncbi:head-tail connector protein [Myroides odoratimimus]|uniref:head-tail connector protein n=1 Tax=Myroides odoratimimus TaxID=76832 RepID=UPI0038D45019
MNADVIVNSEVELVGLNLAKKHLKLEVENDEENELIEVAIASAISSVENYTGRIIREGYFKIDVKGTESFIVERLSLNDSIKEIQIVEKGREISLLPLSSGIQSKRGLEHYEISFKDVVLSPKQSLRVTIDIGFNSKTLPASIKSAMLLLIGEAYEKREDRIQGGNTAVNNLLRPYRKWI